MTFDYGNKKDNGQYEKYPVNTEGEYVAPIRRTYVHSKCGVATTISMDIAKTYAMNPKYYTHTFCVGCKEHFLVSEFKWDDDVTLGEIGVAYPRPKRVGRSKFTQTREEYIYENDGQMQMHIKEMKKYGWDVEVKNDLSVRYLMVQES